MHTSKHHSARIHTIGLGLTLAAAVLLTSATAAANPCPAGHGHEKTSIFHKSPKARLVSKTNRSVDGRTCVRAVKPRSGTRGQLCPGGFIWEAVGVMHDSPKKRIIGSKAVKKRNIRYTCLSIRRPLTARCPGGFKHEKTSIFHKSPKARLVSRPGLSFQGRTCVRIRKPASGTRGQLCSGGFRWEPVGIMHDSPKKRIIGNKAVKKRDIRYTCIKIVKPSFRPGGRA